MGCRLHFSREKLRSDSRCGLLGTLRRQKVKMQDFHSDFFSRLKFDDIPVYNCQGYVEFSRSESGVLDFLCCSFARYEGSDCGVLPQTRMGD